MIILMGLAGAGKGTQAQLLVEQQHYNLISTGDLLRRYASMEQKERMHKGVLLQDEEIFTMIGQALDNASDLNKCLIDGTPRSIPQADWLLKEVGRRGARITAIIHLELPEGVVRERLLQRGRIDDTEEAIAQRFREYYKSTLPLLEHLAQKGVQVIHVQGDQPPEKVHEDIIRALAKVE